MSYDSHARVREMFPVFNEIEDTVNVLNALLNVADVQGLSIRFTQANQKFDAPNGSTVDGPVEPKLNMTTLSWRQPDDYKGG